MIHPSTELRLVDAVIGYGVFATAFIPKGTIIYAQDALEVRVLPDAYSELDTECRAMVEKYSFIDPTGVRVLSWDFAKYVNHRCECNAMSTGWGFEIALRDIHPGEEITDEYGLFNLEYDMPVGCGCGDCRGIVRMDDIDRYHPEWDFQIQSALQQLNDVEQPLISHLPPVVSENLQAYLRGESPYISVTSLKYVPSMAQFSNELVG